MEGKFNGKKILILGLGISGRSAARFLLSNGAEVYAADQNIDAIQANSEVSFLCVEGLKTYHESQTPPIGYFELVIVSPGISKQNPLFRAALDEKVEIIGEVELAFRLIKQPLIAITGTNGKTSVTLMTTHVLNQSGIPAKALGNVGKPITSELCNSSHEVIVAELSSFQLETLSSCIIDAAVILNITPDHLDRYHSMEDYARAKIQVKNFLKPQGTLIMEEAAFHRYGHLMEDFCPMTYGYDNTCHIYSDFHSIFVDGQKRCSLLAEHSGRVNHHVENLMATYALCQRFGVRDDQFFQGISAFKNPIHRIECVKNIEGISFYNDSKGTNIDAVIRAVEYLKEDIVLIAGGVDKGAAYTPWQAAFTGKVTAICAIGQAAPKIKRDLSPIFEVQLFDSLEEAVKFAYEKACPKGKVLLSPGCSSYDMFRDYAHRGEEFKKIVEWLDCCSVT